MGWTTRIVRNTDLRSRIDWDRRLVVFRKPRTAKPDEVFPLEEWHAQHKLDGIRCIVGLEQRSGALVCLTTRPTDLALQYPDLPLWDQLAYRLWAGEWVDGELHVPEQPFETIKTALATCSNKLEFFAFGASFVLPHRSIDWTVEALESRGFVAQLGVSDWCDGVVYKTAHYGKWVKVKHRKTLDGEVVNVKPGTGKYTGQCGSLEIAVMVEYGVFKPVANVSGMDDDTRAAISKEDIGRVCEVAYERVGSQGRLRHPRFLRWRDDKTPEQCDAAQLL